MWRIECSELLDNILLSILILTLLRVFCWRGTGDAAAATVIEHITGKYETTDFDFDIITVFFTMLFCFTEV